MRRPAIVCKGTAMKYMGSVKDDSIAGDKLM